MTFRLVVCWFGGLGLSVVTGTCGSIAPFCYGLRSAILLRRLGADKRHFLLRAWGSEAPCCYEELGLKSAILLRGLVALGPTLGMTFRLVGDVRFERCVGCKNESSKARARALGGVGFGVTFRLVGVTFRLVGCWFGG